MLRVAPLWLNDKHICSWITRPVEPRLISLRGATTLAVWFQSESGWRCQCSELTVEALVHASRVTSFALRVTSRDLFLVQSNPRISRGMEKILEDGRRWKWMEIDGISINFHPISIIDIVWSRVSRVPSKQSSHTERSINQWIILPSRR